MLFDLSRPKVAMAFSTAPLTASTLAASAWIAMAFPPATSIALTTAEAALKHMNEGGRIIMIGSAVGERAVAPGLVPYAATKGAVKMFTQALSREIGTRGITVNNVQPGPIDTDLNPASGDWAIPQKAATALNRYGHIDEVAALVAFVASPDSSYITGANLTVDGGMNA